MAEMSRTFNFDDFDGQIREALEENDDAMAQVYALSGLKRVITPTAFGGLRPGEIGAVIAHSTTDFQPDSLPDDFPPEAA